MTRVRIGFSPLTDRVVLVLSNDGHSAWAEVSSDEAEKLHVQLGRAIEMARAWRVEDGIEGLGTI